MSTLGCASCFDPFATAARIKMLTHVAETADDVAQGRRSMRALEQAVEQWKANRGG